MLVAAFTPEKARLVAVAWLSALKAGELVTSLWCETEVASAVAMKTRTGELAVRDREPVFARVRSGLRERAAFVPIEPDHFDRATDYLRRSERGLRGGDALHLAIAHAAGATLWTLDRKMAEAGQALGLDARLLG